jgi:hypothetical protein
MHEKFWLAGFVVFLIILFLLMSGSPISHAFFPTKEIGGINLPQDVWLRITLQPSVTDLNTNYFSFSCGMEMDIMENSTRKLDYNILLVPPPIIESSNTTGVFVPFQNLKAEGEVLMFSSDYKQSWRSQQYTYQASMSSAYIEKENVLFPGDFYSSSVIYVWFNEPFYPDVVLSPTSSFPRGFTGYLSSPRLITSDEFYRYDIEPFSRLFISPPSYDVMAFQIILQRDASSLLTYTIYSFILLYASGVVLILSRFRVDDLKDRLSIFVGLAIASIAFLWSVGQVVGVISWSEIVLIIMLGFAISVEIKDIKKPTKTRSSTRLLDSFFDLN